MESQTQSNLQNMAKVNVTKRKVFKAVVRKIPAFMTQSQFEQGFVSTITIPFENKIDVLREIDEYTRSLDRRVVQVSANFGASIQEIEILKKYIYIITP